MIKRSFNFFLIIFLTLLIANPNAYAFHKKNMLSKGKYLKYNADEETVKEAKSRVQADYCARTAKESTYYDTETKTYIDEETDFIRYEEIKIKKQEIAVHGYHDTKARKIKGPLRPNLAKLYFKIEDTTKFLEVLKMYCLQDSERGRPSKFKDSYLETLYVKIAGDNGLINEKKNEGDYNLPIGEKIFADGIVVEDKNIVYYLPDFLIEVEKQNIKDKIAAAAAAAEAAEAAAKLAAAKKWVKEHKPELLKKLKAKIKEYDKKIKEINKDFSQLDTALKLYVNTFNFAKDGAEETFNITGNKANKDIKEKLKLLTKKKKSLLNETKIKKFESKLDEIYNRIGTLKELDNYKNIIKLKKKIDQETKSKNKIKGYEDDFNSLKSKKLGSDELAYDIVQLNEEIAKEENLIKDSVILLKEEIDTLDAELSEEDPFDDAIKIAIFVIIFLFVLGLIVYLILQNRKMNEMNLTSESNENKFDRLEDQIRDSSEKMQRAQYTKSRQEKTTLSSVPPQPKEPPKTPAEITFGKYEEMINNYKEALDNFSKLAAFKQKWNGLALTRKERQDGTKTVLINSSRAFEKSEIWCMNFDDRYFALPGSTVKSNMAAYMNLDFEKAQRDFKGVFSISSGSSYFTEVCLLRRGGAGFVVERIGKLQFPQ